MNATSHRIGSALDRSGGIWLPRQVTVACSNAAAITRRPLKECILWFRGVRELTWQDQRKAVVRDLRFLPIQEIVAGLLSNVSTVIGGLRELRELEALVRTPRSASWPQGVNNALYLRTDHWFSLTGGGSVAHTSGVINSLRNSSIVLSIVSTDRLSGLDANTEVTLVPPLYENRAIIKGAAELFYNQTLLRVLDESVARSRPGFIYQRLSYMNYAGAAMRLRHRIPFVCEFNGPLGWMGKHWDREFDLLGRLAERIETLTLGAADLVVVVSDAVRDIAIERGVSPERILVNANGVDPSIYRPDIDATALRTSLGLDGEIVLGFIGTFGEWHGADKLAAAYVKLRSERPELANRIHLLMIGDGPTRARTQAIIEAGGAQGATTFTGSVPQSQGPLYLAACDVLVSPHVPNPDGSRFFGSPTKLFEYMAMGRGIVASRLDQIAEILSHDKTAWLVEPGDEALLAAGMARLIEDTALRERLGAAAREDAGRLHTWRAHVGRILAALERCRASA